MVAEKISVMTLVDLLIIEAYQQGASDIHIDPTESGVTIKFRIDGIIIHKYFLEKILHSEIISRIKILSRLRTDEHIIPQDGRLRFDKNSFIIDIRVSVISSYHGESIVLRLLKDSVQAGSLLDLGISSDSTKKLTEIINRKHGMIIVTGPTGSGKTTTLYTLLKIINSGARSIITIEDPIEYSISGIRQIQINPARGLNFAQGLRAIVRQDPDVVMVGEIRDRETAAIASQTALTGHMLLTSMHSPRAATALPRLLEMAVDSYIVASTVDVVVSQRLVRKLCPLCKTSRDMTAHEKEILRTTELEISTPTGCASCHMTGFSGRIGIYEILIVTDEIRQAVTDHAPAHHIQHLAAKSGMISMQADGYTKVLEGLTSLEEVMSTLHE